MNKITMLGTGNATVTQIYNTCFVLATDTTRLLVDAGGGNGILSQLKKVDFPISEVHHLFVTHAHTDHVLGVKNLILYHTEEKTLATRKEKYSQEAAEYFKGRIVVPDDLEVIEL